ncbi:MAG: M1 family metallopeptidase, partial [Alphaproteobacteria bacterium]|nr:M1 family metallopeptidase [Alphaproteobacteria bacterium]
MAPASVAQATQQLPQDAVPIHYDIHVTPDANTLRFSGNEHVDMRITRSTANITLNAANLEITKATADGRLQGMVTLDKAAQTATIHFAGPLGVGIHRLALSYTGKINNSSAGFFYLDYKGEGGKNERMLLTQFEAPDARRFAPLWDEPAIKATFTLSVTLPAAQNAYSNMPAAKTSLGADGTKEVVFQQSPKMSSYLLFLGLGNLERHTFMSGRTEVGIITRKGAGHRGDYALASAARILKYYNDYFGTPYPLPKLDMVAAPGQSQFFSAMENWGAILYFEDAVLVDPKLSSESDKQDAFITIAHEMAHQWFGDLVTMKWWDDLWLNEGFASWMEIKATNALNPEWHVDAQTIDWARQAAFNLDSRSSTHPIIRHIDSVDQLAGAFDNITYLKGQAVIGMIEGQLGADKFRAGIRNYMARYKYGNTETDQLWDELEKASGKDIKTVAHAFTLQGGVPLIRVRSDGCTDGKRRVMLDQDRFGADAASKEWREWPVPVNIRSTTGNGSATVRGHGMRTINVAGCAQTIINPGQTGYYRTMYDGDTTGEITKSLAKLPLIDQIGIINDARALAGAEYQPASVYLDMISAIPATADPLVWEMIARDLGGYDTLFADTAMRPAFRARALALLHPQWARIGLAPKPGESSSMSQLRETLIGTLAQLGDADARAQIHAALQADFAGTAKLPGATRKSVLYAYAGFMSAADWDALHARAKSETDPLLKQDEYQALGSTRDQA